MLFTECTPYAGTRWDRVRLTSARVLQSVKLRLRSEFMEVLGLEKPLGLTDGIVHIAFDRRCTPTVTIT